VSSPIIIECIVKKKINKKPKPDGVFAFKDDLSQMEI
tara:strand:- start:396 stop:506 length:111 start_codon:yes stop_codon:yes gene_type:complete